MKRFITTLAAALCGIVSSSAFAAAPHPTAKDGDGDGFYVATVDVNGDDNVDHADIGVQASAYDCDDFAVSVNPKAPERPYDSVDNDCYNSTSDVLTDLTEPQFRLFLKKEYDGVRPTSALVDYETGQCKADTANCRINTIAGRFELLTGAKVFVDVKRNGTDVLWGEPCTGRDGRELVDPDVASHSVCYDEASGTRRSGRSTASGGSDNGSGVGRTYVDGSVAVLRDEAKKEREERMAAEAALEGRVGALEGVVRVSAEASAAAAAEAGLATLDNALAEEIREDLVGLEASNVALRKSVELVVSHGPLLEVYSLAGAMYGAPVVDDMILRQAGLYGLGAGLNVGLDGDGYRAVAFTTLVVGRDGGVGPAHVEMIGVEAMLERLRAAFGGFGAYGTRHSQEDGLRSSVVGRFALVGVSLARADAIGRHPTTHLRVGCGPEFVSAAGSNGVASAVSGTCSVTIGVGVGVGALR